MPAGPPLPPVRPLPRSLWARPAHRRRRGGAHRGTRDSTQGHAVPQRRAIAKAEARRAGSGAEERVGRRQTNPVRSDASALPRSLWAEPMHRRGREQVGRRRCSPRSETRSNPLVARVAAIRGARRAGVVSTSDRESQPGRQSQRTALCQSHCDTRLRGAARLARWWRGHGSRIFPRIHELRSRSRRCQPGRGGCGLGRSVTRAAPT